MKKVMANLFECLFGNGSVDAVKDFIRRLSCRRNMYYAYVLSRDLASIVREFRAQASSKNIAEKEDAFFWCAYLVSLLSGRRYNAAKEILEKFVNEGDGRNYVCKYFKLAEFAKSIGLDVCGCDRVVDVGHRLFESHERHPFERLVDGKSVALVGNGPTELNTCNGREIDAHDIVIRINNFVINGYEQDYGTRTDVWVKRSDALQRHDLVSADVKLVVYESNFERIVILDGYLDAIEDDLNHERIDFCGQEDKQECMDAIHAYPTTGATLCEKLRRSKAACVDLYGFSFLQETRMSNERFTHYGNDISNEALLRGLKNSHHRVDREADYLRHFFPKGRRLVK